MTNPIKPDGLKNTTKPRIKREKKQSNKYKKQKKKKKQQPNLIKNAKEMKINVLKNFKIYFRLTTEGNSLLSTITPHNDLDDHPKRWDVIVARVHGAAARATYVSTKHRTN